MKDAAIRIQMSGTGLLNADSKVEFRIRERTGSNWGSIQCVKLQSFTPAIATISGPASIVVLTRLHSMPGSGLNSYLWSTGSTVQTTSVTTAGNYNVR